MKQRVLFLLGIGIFLMSIAGGCMRLRQAEETDETGGTKIIEITQSGAENEEETLAESFRIDDATGSVVWMTEDWVVTEQLLMTDGQIGYDTVTQVYAIATGEKLWKSGMHGAFRRMPITQGRNLL